MFVVRLLCLLGCCCVCWTIVGFVELLFCFFWAIDLFVALSFCLLERCVCSDLNNNNNNNNKNNNNNIMKLYLLENILKKT